MEATTNTTPRVTMTGIHLVQALAYLEGADTQVDGNTVSFVPGGDLAKAKAAHLAGYLAEGGNPRNKRAIASTWATIARAIAKAGA